MEKDRIFSALGHPIRLHIVERLMEKEATVSEIAEPYAVSLNAVSKHLKILESVGLVDREIRGREHYCRINPQPLKELATWVDTYRSFWQVRLDAMEKLLNDRKKKSGPDDIRSGGGLSS